MSNFFETFLAATLGVTAFYILEALYYEIKMRLDGHKYIRMIEDLEDETWDI